MPEPIATFDEGAVRNELKELVRRTVKDTLNALLEGEAEDLVGAVLYERTADREAYRAGHCERSLATTSGNVTLRMPKLKGMRFAAAIIERYKRRETSVEETMIEMYLAGISTRRIEDVSEILLVDTPGSRLECWCKPMNWRSAQMKEAIAWNLDCLSHRFTREDDDRNGHFKRIGRQ